jgi:glycerol-3-phosphate O-acyltransferase
VVAPTHSSNLDSLVLGVAMHRVHLPPCVYAAGKHMYRNAVLARLMGSLGAYRVDRARTAGLYRDVLKEYSTELLDRGFHSVIFPGATRCRTNEIESQLKLGLLGTTSRTSRPVVIVPVTISYQVVLEAETLIRHYLEGRAEERIAGGARRGLAAVLRRLGALEQAVVVTFGEPLDPASDVLSLAREVTRAYRRDTVLFATHVVARALYDLASARARTADIHELLCRDRAALRFSAPAAHAAITSVVTLIRSTREHGTLHRDVETLDPARMVTAALGAWAACHARSPVIARDGELVLDDVGLLYFYRNRTSHLGHDR